MDAGAGHQGLDGFERAEETLLLVPGKQLLSEGEKHLVLFVDVSAQQGRVAANGLSDLVIIVLGHGPYQRPALLVLLEHDPERAAVPRNAVALHRREQVLLLFAVVALVSEGAEEVPEPAEGLPVHGLAGLEALAEPLQKREGSQDHLVFVTEHLHGTVRLMVAVRAIRE